MDEPTITVTDDPEHRRYDLRVDGEPAGAIVYRPSAGGARILLHTGVEAAFEGRGLGSKLIAGALADCRSHGLAVLPQCPFVKAYLMRHPEELDVVRPGDRLAYGLPPA